MNTPAWYFWFFFAVQLYGLIRIEAERKPVYRGIPVRYDDRLVARVDVPKE